MKVRRKNYELRKWSGAAFLLLASCFCLCGATQSVVIDTKTHKIVKSPASGSASADFDFTDVTTVGIGGGGGGTPGGSNTQVQYNNSGAFGGISVLTFNGTAVSQQAGTKFNLLDPTDTTKKLQLDLSGISTATTRTLTIPNANSVTVVSDSGTSNNFLTGIGSSGAITKAQPAVANLSDATTVGQNLVKLTNPGAITWLEIAADNSVATKTATQMKTDLALTIGTNVEAWDTQLDSLAGLSYTGNSLKVVRVNSGETGFELATAGGGGTVTNTGGNLTANSVVLGAGTVDTKVVAGIITDGVAKLTLGVNITTLGQIKLFGNGSGDATIQPAGIAGTATVVTLPNASSTLPIFPQQITFTGPTAARTITLPDAAFTVARTDAANTFTGASTTTSWNETTPVIISGLTASGSGSNDFNGSTGAFRTSTGSVTIGPGNTTFSGISGFVPPARSSGSAAYLSINIPADTLQTAATESAGFKTVTATRQWATSGTVALQRENFFAGPTYSSQNASQTFTDAFTLYATPPIAGTNAIFTRDHTLGIVDSTSAASSIAGGLVVATTLGTAATSVGIGGGNVNAGGQFLAADGTSSLPGFAFSSTTGTGLSYVASSGDNVVVSLGGFSYAAFRSTGPFLSLRSTGLLGWSSTTDPIVTPDTSLSRDAAAGVQVNNGTVGQWGYLKTGVRDAGTTTVTNGLTLGHQSTGTPAANFGTGILFNANDSTTADVNAGQVAVAWSDPAHATHASYMDFLLNTAGGANASKARLFGSGGLSVNSTTDPGTGIINANTGFKLSNAEFPIAANGIVKRTGANVYAAGVAKTDYWDTTDFVASGASHAHGLVPDPGVTAGTTKFLREDATWVAPAGGGTVTNTGGNLTSNAVVLGAGTVDTKVVAGIITDGTSKITLGVAGTSVGSVDFKNTTSGTVTVSPVSGALGTVTQSLSTAAGTIAIDNITGHGDSIYTILSTDRIVATNAAFTASRTWTLPSANTLPLGTALTIVDQQGTVTATNTLVIARAGSDTMNGGTANLVLSNAYSSITLLCDGLAKWTTVASKQDVDIQTFTATGAGTWTKPVWFAARFVRVVCVGAGGGGGAGGSTTGAVIRMGGSGGGGGGYAEAIYSASDLGATESVSVGVGGTAGVTGGSGAVGGAGGIGGSSTFGTTVRLKAGGGGGGAGGAITAAAGGGGGGGGLGQAGTSGTTAGGAGGGPGTSSGHEGRGMDGSVTALANPAATGGGSGGGHDATPSAVSAGGTSFKGGGGGGQGSGATAVPALVAGKAGGDTNVVTSGGGGGGAVGTDGASPTAGGVGADGTSVKSGQGGGGGGGTITTNTAGAAGGAGGAVGGGGGGGGCGTNNQGGGGGGIGGRGEIRVFTW